MPRLKPHPKLPRLVADAATRGAGFGRVELFGFLLIVFAVTFSCSNYNPVTVNPPGKGTLPAPTKILVKVGNGVVELTWAFESDTTQVKEYRVYRKDQAGNSFQQIASTKMRRYRDNSLTNGVRFLYQIAAVNKSNVEGARSDSVAAIPAIYSIQLAGGARYTNSPNVTLAITAPSNTALMMISNDSSFAGAKWEAVVTPRSWTLTFGDGKKRVFVKFRNVNDQETSSPVQAEIVLDTIANIKSFKVDTTRLKALKTLHFELKADEKDGVATADIVDAVNSANGQERNIRLYDDGTNGDRFKEDGVYERDYIVRTGLEVVNAYLYGNFTDAAKNVAAVATSPIRVTIQSPPTAVVLQEPTAIAGSMTSLSLRWTPNTDTDFASYQIRRAQDANVSLSSLLVKEFTDPKVISYVDNGLDPGTQYFYRVYVFDTAGNSTGSNTGQKTTPTNSPPAPVVLQEPTTVGGSMTSLSLRWTANTDTDFGSYQIRRAQDANVSLSSFLVKELNDAGITNYVDSGLNPGTQYFYRVYVFDKAGNSTGSNVAQSTTPADAPPAPVVLQEPTTIAGSSTSLSLRWTPNSDDDFASYQIRRSLDPVVSLSSILVKEFNDPKVTSYVDNGLEPGTKYFYRVYVFDAAGKNAGSNIVQQTTPANEAPKAVVLAQPVQEATVLRVSWSPSTEKDFAHYRLYRSTASPVDTTTAPLAVISNVATTEYRDTSVATNVLYYYRLFVFDQFGLSTGSNEVQGKLK